MTWLNLNVAVLTTSINLDFIKAVGEAPQAQAGSPSQHSLTRFLLPHLAFSTCLLGASQPFALCCCLVLYVWDEASRGSPSVLSISIQPEHSGSLAALVCLEQSFLPRPGIQCWNEGPVPANQRVSYLTNSYSSSFLSLTTHYLEDSVFGSRKLTKSLLEDSFVSKSLNCWSHHWAADSSAYTWFYSNDVSLLAGPICLPCFCWDLLDLSSGL